MQNCISHASEDTPWCNQESLSDWGMAVTWRHFQHHFMNQNYRISETKGEGNCKHGCGSLYGTNKNKVATIDAKHLTVREELVSHLIIIYNLNFWLAVIGINCIFDGELYCPSHKKASQISPNVLHFSWALIDADRTQLQQGNSIGSMHMSSVRLMHSLYGCPQSLATNSTMFEFVAYVGQMLHLFCVPGDLLGILHAHLPSLAAFSLYEASFVWGYGGQQPSVNVLLVFQQWMHKFMQNSTQIENRGSGGETHQCIAEQEAMGP